MRDAPLSHQQETFHSAVGSDPPTLLRLLKPEAMPAPYCPSVEGISEPFYSAGVYNLVRNVLCALCD